MIEDMIITPDGTIYPVEFASHEMMLIQILESKTGKSKEEVKQYLRDLYAKYEDEVFEIGIENRTGIPDAVAIELGYGFAFTGFMGFSVPIVLLRTPLNEKMMNSLNKENALGNIDSHVYDYFMYRNEDLLKGDLDES